MGGRRIRRARSDEAESLSALALRSKAHWGYSQDFLEACREELSVSAAALEKHPAYLLEEDGVTLGFYLLVPLAEEEAELDSLFVEPEAIGTGAGAELIAHAIREARGGGCRRLVIHADPNATRFYEAAGARVVGSTPSGSIPGRRLPLLHLELSDDR